MASQSIVLFEYKERLLKRKGIAITITQFELSTKNKTDPNLENESEMQEKRPKTYMVPKAPRSGNKKRLIIAMAVAVVVVIVAIAALGILKL